MLRKVLTAACCCVVALALARPAAADTVTLKNGREVYGRVVEEKADYIVFKVTNAGQIKIMKKEILTFTEDDQTGANWRGTGRTDAAGTTKPEDKKDEKKDDRELTDEDKKAIKKLKDELETALKALGKSTEERLKEAEPTDDERGRINDLIEQLKSNRGAHRSNPSSDQDPGARINKSGRQRARENTATELATMGIKVIKTCADGIGSMPTVGAKQGVAMCLSKVVVSDDAKWLAFYHDVPSKLLALLEEQSDEFAGRARFDANAALKTITGQDVGYPQVTDEAEFRSAQEAECAQRWRKIVLEQSDKFRKELTEAEAKRTKLAEKVKLLDGKDWKKALEEDKKEKDELKKKEGGEKKDEKKDEKKKT